ncbi:PhzF family phenazine biosynthesis protein [Priestia megaterium]|uniref:PhzF family phenazine biosynthesis protein n=1 Tax=Priestia megaterium TaxID=1404 RepID=UPI002E1F3E34|nr:PhzF family phenazine biosynthesis protein [Priestia megaterium]MED4268373.1 PhzF family phenazine biosynthesis protein [Priestia megaterium]MED4279266.1 PhzF family phenazine biosynthesis protein [Priestia megaterium]MED4314656.1 PhzF family phenazine biosynthesis protein [Priestia megaterium]
MRYYVVDAFAEKIFEGNPAGVCIMNEWLPDDTMQNIAIENNLSETAFAVKEENGYHLRWFTPGGEIDLCGHATLATAYILFRFVETSQESIVFNSKSGELTVTKKGDLYELDFPIIFSEKYPVSEQMIAALGVEPLETYKGNDLIFLLESEEAVQNLKPNFEKMKDIPEGIAVFVTAKGSKHDYVARAFFPKLNLNEDPVTGAMQCSLVPFWTERLGKKELIVRQLSKRGGTIYCKNNGDRVKISGPAALYSIGDIFID